MPDTKRVPNGKTLAVLSNYPNLTKLYLDFCAKETKIDSCRNLKSNLASSIIVLQRAMRTMAEVEELGQKQSPAGGITFSFGGQLCRGKLISAADYLDTATSVIEQILPQCLDTLELIAQTMLRVRATEKAHEEHLVK